MRVWVPGDALLDEFAAPPTAELSFVQPEGPLPGDAGEVEFVVVAPDLVERLFEAVPEAANLRVVQTLSAGVEALVDRLPSGVTLCNASGVHDGPVSEWIVAQILALRRRLYEYRGLQDAHEWDNTAGAVNAGRAPSVGGLDDLAEANVLIVGYGSIGRAVTRRLEPFGAVVTGVAGHARDGVHGIDELEGLVPEADVVVILAPSTPATRQLVDEHFLNRMRDGALLVNAARGDLVDTAALERALRAGHVRAALDVTDPEPLPADHSLWTAPGLVITPHVAGSTPRWKARAYRLAGQQLRRYEAGDALVNVQRG